MMPVLTQRLLPASHRGGNLSTHDGLGAVALAVGRMGLFVPAGNAPERVISRINFWKALLSRVHMTPEDARRYTRRHIIHR